MSNEIKLFLSYASEDHELVSPLYERFQADGFTPWMDRFDILPGEKYELAIGRALRESEFFLTFLSPLAVAKRGYVQAELKEALRIRREMLEEDIYCIPVRLEPCEPPESLREYHYVDLFASDGWARLILAIRRGMERRG